MAERVPDQQGLTAARRVARWYIGDSRWADTIVDAYLNPDRANKTLKEEMSHD